MTLETTLEEHLEKTVQTLNKLRNTLKEESKFVFALVWILVDKFIVNDETRQRLSNILSDNMKLMEEFGQRKYKEGEKRGEKIGRETSRREITENLLKKELPLELISEATNVPISQLEEIIAKN